MNKPLITTKCGIYTALEENGFENLLSNDPSGGIYINKENYQEKIQELFKNYNAFSPRKFCIKNKLTKTENNSQWRNILEIE